MFSTKTQVFLGFPSCLCSQESSGSEGSRKYRKKTCSKRECWHYTLTWSGPACSKKDRRRKEERVRVHPEFWPPEAWPLMRELRCYLNRDPCPIITRGLTPQNPITLYPMNPSYIPQDQGENGGGGFHDTIICLPNVYIPSYNLIHVCSKDIVHVVQRHRGPYLASLERYDLLYLLLFLIFFHPFLFLIFMFSAFLVFFKG